MTFRDLAAEDAELIAAFIDKRLSEEERKAFLERLDKDESLYEVFVETVRYRDQGAGEGGKVLVPSAWGRKWSVLAAVAALIAVAVATPVLLRTFSEESYAEALVADGRLEPYLEEGWYEQGWSVMRGIRPGTSDADTAFRLGVQVVDLEVALLTEKRKDAVALTQRIEALLQEVEFSEPVQLAYTVLRVDIQEDKELRWLSSLTVSSERLLRKFLRDYEAAYELGRWAETGRLAARSGNQKFLRSRHFRHQLAAHRQENWSEQIAANLDNVSKVLAGSSKALDLESLEALFASMIGGS